MEDLYRGRFISLFKSLNKFKTNLMGWGREGGDTINLRIFCELPRIQDRYCLQSKLREVSLSTANTEMLQDLSVRFGSGATE